MASAQDKVKLAREVLDALIVGDVPRALELSDPGVEWYSFFALGEGGAYRGHDGTRRFSREVREAFESIGAEFDDWLVLGDLAFIVGRIRYRGKASGVEATHPCGWVFKFREGKVAYFRAFSDPERVLGRVGIDATQQSSPPTSD